MMCSTAVQGTVGVVSHGQPGGGSGTGTGTWSMCRLCLVQCDEVVRLPRLLPLTEDIRHMFYVCTNIKVTDDDGLPKQICPRCTNDIRHCYNFINLCKNTDTALRAYFNIKAKDEHSEDGSRVAENSDVFVPKFKSKKRKKRKQPKCSVCKVKLSSKRDLVKHFAQEHSDGPKIESHLCNVTPSRLLKKKFKRASGPTEDGRGSPSSGNETGESVKLSRVRRKKRRERENCLHSIRVTRSKTLSVNRS